MFLSNGGVNRCYEREVVPLQSTALGEPKLTWIVPLPGELGVVVPTKHLMEELGLEKGDMIVFERVGEHFVIRKLEASKRRLEETMSWNPERTAEPEPVSPEEIKGIWKA